MPRWIVLLLLSACGGSPAFTLGDAGTASEPCNVTAPTSCPDPAPTYEDIQPIAHARCVPCHGAVPNGQWALDDYSHLSDWKNEIRAEIVACRMPPEDAGVAITNAERAALLAWIRCGLPR